MSNSKKDFTSSIAFAVQEYFKPITGAIDELSKKVKSIDKNKVVDDIVDRMNENLANLQKTVKEQFESKALEPIYREDVSWPEVNEFMHSFGKMLNPELKNEFYDSLVGARAKNPHEVIKAIFAFIESKSK